MNLDHLFYYPTQTVYSAPEDYGLRYESVFFDAPTGERLHGWFFPAEGEPSGTVVHFHGNAGNVTGHFEHVRWLPPQGWSLFCFDYRGYGRSQGRPTRAGTIADAHAAVDYAKSRDDVDAAKIVVLGTSLGGAIAPVVAAARDDIRGLVLDSAFSNYRQEIKWVLRRKWYTWGVAGLVSRWLFSDAHNAVDHIAAVAPRPILIIQGTADRIVDPHMSEALYAAAREPKELWMIEGLNHTAVFDEMLDEACPRVLRFFESCVNSQAD